MTFSVALRIWDAIPRNTNGVRTYEPRKHVEKPGEIKSMLTLLDSMLKIFEVALADVVGDLTRLTTATSSTMRSGLTFDWIGFVRY